MSTLIASLIAKVSADTSQGEAALNSFGNKLKSLAGQGSFAGDALGASFQKAVYGAQNAATAVNTAGNSMTRWDRLVQAALPNMGRFGNSALQVSGALKGIGAEAAIAGVAVIGTIAGATALYKMSEFGAGVEYVSTKFDRLSKSVGTTGNALLEDLRTATKGTRSDFELMQQGNDLFQLGLAKDAEEAIRLSRVMTALKMDTGELTLALANQSKRRLDQLGLSLTEFNKNEAAFKKTGVDAQEAFKMAFLKTAEDTVMRVGNAADMSTGSFDRLTASWENLKNTTALASADMFVGFNNGLARTIDTVVKYEDASRRYVAWAKSTGQFIGPMGPNAQDVRAFAERTKDDRPRMATGGGIAAAPEVDTTNYENLLKVSRSLTDVTGSYNDKLNQLAEKLIDAPKKYGATAEQADELKKSLTGLNAMTEQYNVTLFRQLQELTKAESAYGKNDSRVRELREGINALKEDAINANNEMMLATLKSAGATDQQQLGFARASGMISEQAFQQAAALGKIADMYMKNEITASRAAQAARGVMQGLASISGFNAIAYVDIYYRYHGAQSHGIALPTISTGSGSTKRDTQYNAVGGPVGAGEISGITEYGEPEVFTSGGRRYLISGNAGYVSPLNAMSSGGRSSMEDMHAIVSRIPSAEENARALVKAMKGANWG